jgi:CheY-like chemotaxis protein
MVLKQDGSGTNVDQNLVTRHTISDNLGTDEPVIEPLDILFAEDNDINREVVTKMLSRTGHRVVAVDDGRHAVSQYKSNRFDLIILDIQMPFMDGIEAARHIRDYEKNRENDSGVQIRTPIIALTADVITGTPEQLIEVGMDDYITKPIHRNNLLHVISRCLEAYKRNQAES